MHIAYRLTVNMRDYLVTKELISRIDRVGQDLCEDYQAVTRLLGAVRSSEIQVGNSLINPHLPILAILA